ncbi:glycosyltransferase family 2 protein [Metabacillus idriensis]|uniref:glycosyltransferase family 2 protein n=1 Tax=Metabacillus idriensis TaxID=324768 RepID=UPI003D28AE5A
MDIKVSVIIPVYNAEEYLSRCLTSLTSQTLKECEFIFVNDGSIDNSVVIINKYILNDKRIKLINQNNMGVSIARNTGLKNATGEYIGFVDADDYVSLEFFEKMYSAASENNCDVVFSNMLEELEGKQILTKYPFQSDINLYQSYINENILPYFIKADNLNSVCNKIFKHEVLQKYMIKFPERVELGEDSIFNIIVFSYAYKVKYLNITGYYYKEVKGSATRNIIEKDYFKRSLQVYSMKYPDIFEKKIANLDTQHIRSIKLINSVFSYIYIYLNPRNQMKFSKKLKYVSSMIGNDLVRESLPFYYVNHYKHASKYEKLIYLFVKRKSSLGLLITVLYSWFRNN